MQHTFTLRDLPNAERPRERLENFGAEALSAPELLALVLSRGIRGQSVSALAQHLIVKFGSLEGLTQVSLAELRRLRGLGLAKAATLQACFEIARRLNNEVPNPPENKIISTPAQLFQLVRARVINYHKEHLVVLCFDSRGRCLGVDTVSIGTLNANLVHPREVFDVAIRRHAEHIILAHNHPSSDLEPSENDLDITSRMVSSGNIMGIRVTEHIIVSKKAFFSFKEHGLI